MMDDLRDKKIVLGVSGSIAAFKAVALASELTKLGALVDVILTPDGARFVQPLSFQALTHRAVVTNLFDDATSIAHVSLGVGADAFVVAPATADCVAGLALGLGHDALLATALSSRAPLVVAPAMETLMYEHPATQANLETLRRRGATILEPAVGSLASGRTGRGRMSEPLEIIACLRAALGAPGSRDLEPGLSPATEASPPKPAATQDLAGRIIVVTAGGTQEAIDPVRYIGNRSTGKMGYAIAEAARDRGAEVILISAPASIPAPAGVELRAIQTAREMQQAVEVAIVGADAIVMSAAVADYRVEEAFDHKLKRTEDSLVLHLVPNPDIIGGIQAAPLVKVAFAAETDDVLANATGKLRRKGVDLIVANDVTSPGSGFGTDTNQVILVDQSGADSLPLMSKREVGDRILDRVVAILAERAVTAAP